MALSPSGLSKRGCIAATTCLVDGCTADLSNFKKYHQRHKLCQLHSQSPQVSINGQNLHFCLQCSRFHSLEEFDKGKRSCRKRLDWHNRRRRKPQQHIFSNHLGTNMLQLAGPPVHPAPTNPLWTVVVETSHRNNKLFYDNNQPPAGVDHSDFLSLSTSLSQASYTSSWGRPLKLSVIISITVAGILYDPEPWDPPIILIIVYNSKFNGSESKLCWFGEGF